MLVFWGVTPFMVVRTPMTHLFKAIYRVPIFTRTGRGPLLVPSRAKVPKRDHLGNWASFVGHMPWQGYWPLAPGQRNTSQQSTKVVENDWILSWNFGKLQKIIRVLWVGFELKGTCFRGWPFLTILLFFWQRKKKLLSTGIKQMIFPIRHEMVW